MRVAILSAAVVLGLTTSSPSSRPITRHDAKVRAFRALLAITEERPDAADATHARITVGACVHTSYGMRCVGELAPVLFSGIPGSRCRYVVRVTHRRTSVLAGSC